VTLFRGTVDGKRRSTSGSRGSASSSTTPHDIVPAATTAGLEPKERFRRRFVRHRRQALSTAGRRAYEITGSPVPIGPGDALADVQSCDLMSCAISLLPNTSAAGGRRFRLPRVGGGGSSTSGRGSVSAVHRDVFSHQQRATEYLRRVLYGLPSRPNGVLYFWAYTRTQIVHVHVQTQPHGVPACQVPFRRSPPPDAVRNAGPAQGWRYDAASGWLLLRAHFAGPRDPDARRFRLSRRKLVSCPRQSRQRRRLPEIPKVEHVASSCAGILRRPIDWQSDLVRGQLRAPVPVHASSPQ